MGDSPCFTKANPTCHPLPPLPPLPAKSTSPALPLPPASEASPSQFDELTAALGERCHFLLRLPPPGAPTFDPSHKVAHQSAMARSTNRAFRGWQGNLKPLGRGMQRARNVPQIGFGGRRVAPLLGAMRRPYEPRCGAGWDAMRPVPRWLQVESTPLLAGVQRACHYALCERGV